MTLLEQIREKSKVQFRPASEAEIRALQTMRVPEDALQFYRGSTPTRTTEIGKVRLCTVGDMVVENRDAVPGRYAFGCGYVVFATTECGDVFCFDIRAISYPASSSIVLIAHDLEPENDEMVREDLVKLAKPIAPSFQSFLYAFVAGTLDTMPLYPPHNFGNPGDMTHP